MTLRDIALICFAAASVIHGSQTVLVAKLRRERKGLTRGEAIEGIAIWGAAFLWQFGNFLLALAATPQFDGPAEGWHTVFWTANLVRDVVLATFPLLFSYICSQIPADGSKSARLLLRLGRILRYVLWPLTGVAVVAMVAADTGLPLPFLSGDLAGWVILHTMLFYFLIFMVSTVVRRAPAQSGVPARMRAHKATVIAAVVGVTVFVLMLSGYWHLPVPFLQYIGLAAMLTSVPFSIASAYKLYQYAFMDAFIREVLSGVTLLAIFAAALSANSSVLWITLCAVVLVYSKAPLTRWVERTFLGYGESVEEQEERIGTAIRALTQLDEFAARVSEILSKELEAEWVEISPQPRAQAVNEFQIPGSGLVLSLGPRVGGRQFMSRQLRIARTAALQLAAHHHQLHQQKLQELTARAEIRALRAQINPHFLFNTLNSVSSLVRFDPDRARELILKLSKILRRLLGKHDEFVQLRDEIEFVDDYLDIEVVRFGRDKLRVYKHLDPETLDIVIPAILLQPLVENCIKHGLAPKVDGGSITIRSRIQDNKLMIQVEDDGVGMSAPPAVAAEQMGSGRGIGMVNVAERLHVLFGDEGKLTVQSRDGHGTLVMLEMPVLDTELPAAGAAAAIYAARSNTRS
jgi:anti-sigma regulatory factor (Ser/Thr protein kinase)